MVERTSQHRRTSRLQERGSKPTTTAQTRLEAIKLQLSLALTFCAVAETKLGFGRVDEARRLIQEVRHRCEFISRHLDQPGHVPPTAVDELRDQLVHVELRIFRVEPLFEDNG